MPGIGLEPCASLRGAVWCFSFSRNFSLRYSELSFSRARFAHKFVGKVHLSGLGIRVFSPCGNSGYCGGGKGKPSVIKMS